MAEEMIEANGVELGTEAFGDPHDPPIPLITGTDASMLSCRGGLLSIARGRRVGS